MSTAKDMLLDYTSKKFRKNQISAQDVYEVLREEFPEFVTQVCEGYYQAGYKDATDEAEKSDKKHSKKHRKGNTLEPQLY
jgi:hypothetical protein